MIRLCETVRGSAREARGQPVRGGGVGGVAVSALGSLMPGAPPGGPGFPRGPPGMERPW